MRWKKKREETSKTDRNKNYKHCGLRKWKKFNNTKI